MKMPWLKRNSHRNRYIIIYIYNTQTIINILFITTYCSKELKNLEHNYKGKYN